MVVILWTVSRFQPWRKERSTLELPSRAWMFPSASLKGSLKWQCVFLREISKVRRVPFAHLHRMMSPFCNRNSHLETDWDYCIHQEKNWFFSLFELKCPTEENLPDLFSERQKIISFPNIFDRVSFPGLFQPAQMDSGEKLAARGWLAAIRRDFLGICSKNTGFQPKKKTFWHTFPFGKIRPDGLQTLSFLVSNRPGLRFGDLFLWAWYSRQYHALSPADRREAPLTVIEGLDVFFSISESALWSGNACSSRRSQKTGGLPLPICTGWCPHSVIGTAIWRLTGTTVFIRKKIFFQAVRDEMSGRRKPTWFVFKTGRNNQFSEHFWRVFIPRPVPVRSSCNYPILEKILRLEDGCLPGGEISSEFVRKTPHFSLK